MLAVPSDKRHNRLTKIEIWPINTFGQALRTPHSLLWIVVLATVSLQQTFVRTFVQVRLSPNLLQDNCFSFRPRVSAHNFLPLVGRVQSSESSQTMAKDDLIASIFSSAVKTSLSAQKAAPKKKVVGKNESQAAHVSAKPKQVTGIAAPTENQDWVGVTNKKANKSKNTALVASAPVAISKTGATSKDALTSNAFYLPKSLEKHLHKAVTTNLEDPKLSVTKNTAVPSQFTKGQPQLTKSQRKNQLRAQKRAKKRKLQDLNQKLQDLTFGANIEAPKVIVIEQVDTRSVDTSTRTHPLQ